MNLISSKRLDKSKKVTYIRGISTTFEKAMQTQSWRDTRPTTPEGDDALVTAETIREDSVVVSTNAEEGGDLMTLEEAVEYGLQSMC